MTQTAPGTRGSTERGYLVIDSDAHVVESEHTWDFMDASDQQYRPVIISSKEDPSVRYWYADGKTRRPAAILFDLDGTLIDTIELILSSARFAFEGWDALL